MSKTTHTPAPWRVTVNGGFDSDGNMVASAWIEAGPYHSLATLMPVPEVAANARLIAAAPDMFAVLKKLLAAHVILDEYGDEVRAAVAAAEGSAVSA